MHKRGESTIVANLILFIAVMGMAGTVAFVFKTIMDDNTNAAAEESGRTTSIVNTDFTITTATYLPGNVYVYVKNTGKESFDPDDIDIYLDGIRIPRNDSNRTVQVTVDTDLINTDIWDEKEELEFRVFQNYSVPETHDVTVYTPNGVKAEGSFSS